MRGAAGWLAMGALALACGMDACASYKAILPDGGATGGTTGSGGSTGTGGSGPAGTGGGGTAGATGSGGAAGAGTGGSGMGGSSSGSGGATAGAGGSPAGTGGTATGTGGMGTGGTPDAGTDRAGTRALGESCVGNGDCASTHCTGSICCDQTCAGPCAQCSSTGHCQMPADDPAWGTISCPADTPCRDWATPITANRCKAVGQCKAATDCVFVNAPAKTYCGPNTTVPGSALVCDSTGNCVNPTVTCGPDGECSIGSAVCCVTTGTSCSATCAQHNLAMFCDERTDCPPGTVSLL